MDRAPGGAPWGRLEAGLADRRVRDGVLVALVPGTGDLPERCVREPCRRHRSSMRRSAAAMALIIDPSRGVVPPATRDGGARGGARGGRGAGRTGAQAPALTLLALLAWWRGDGARARLLLDRALDADARVPAWRELLDDALSAAIPPGWVRHAD